MVITRLKIWLGMLALASIVVSACTGGSNPAIPTIVTLPSPTSSGETTTSNQQMSGTAPLSIQFSVIDAPGIVSAEWDFGDGTTSTELAPEHTFTNPGTYEVRLTATGENESAIVTYTVEVLPDPILVVIRTATTAPAATQTQHPTNSDSSSGATATPTATPGPSDWTRVGDMARGRWVPSATTTLGGTVLVVGGEDTLAEIYDPSAQDFTATVGLNCRHAWGHTATLLTDGKILIVGGEPDIDCAEIYDPNTNLSRRINDLHIGHRNHTATLLTNGTVLIAGGFNISEDQLPLSHNVAEIFDPETETFNLTGTMTTDRSQHTASLLPSGNVLITGGIRTFPSVNGTSEEGHEGAEIFDRKSGSFTSLGNSFNLAIWHVATPLADGNVLFTTELGTATIFDWESNSLRQIATMNKSSQDHRTTLLPGGEVLITGGHHPVNSLLEWHSTVETFDPTTERFSLVDFMHRARSGHATALLADGSVLVVGGVTTSAGANGLPEKTVASKTAEIWNPTISYDGSVGLANIDTLPSVTTINTRSRVFQGHSYLLVDDAPTYSEASAYATSLGGYLVTINSAVENAFVTALAGSHRHKSILIGLSDQDSEGNFVWANGEALTFSNWADGEPSNAGPGYTNEDFVVLRDELGAPWNDVPGSPGQFIIEFDTAPVLAQPLLYPEFNSVAGLNLVGDGAQVGGRLRLAPARELQVGAAWSTTKQLVEDDFETTFRFQITEPFGTGADGFVFVIQNWDKSALGTGGGPMGYNGIPNSIAIEFDTFLWTPDNDPDGNHVSVQTQGRLSNTSNHDASKGSVRPTFDMSDGSVHEVKISYIPGTLNIYLDNLSSPALTVSLDIAKTLSLDDGTAWIGFTAGTGAEDFAGYENYDILSWTFSETPTAPLALVPTPSPTATPFPTPTAIAPPTPTPAPPTATPAPIPTTAPLTALASSISSQPSRLATGARHTCALTISGEARCWGDNEFGQLGDGTTVDRITPEPVTGISTKLVSLSAGQFQTCALTAEGAVKCWGGGGATPVDVPGLDGGIAAISVGNSHACALTKTGGAKCWGSNTAGQLGDGTTASGTTTAIDDAMQELHTRIIDGEDRVESERHLCVSSASSPTGVYCWANSHADTAVDVEGLASGVVAVAAGESHSCALTTTGGIKCWGINVDLEPPLFRGVSYDKSPIDLYGLTSNVAAISVQRSICFVTMSGEAGCWGLADVSNPDVTASDISAGQNHTCALTTAGGVRCWGISSAGTSDPVSSGALSISAGFDHTCTVMGNDNIQCWGSNSYGQLGDGTTTYRPEPVQVIGMES